MFFSIRCGLLFLRFAAFRFFVIGLFPLSTNQISKMKACGGLSLLVSICLLSSLRFLSNKLGLGPHFNLKMLEMLENFGELLTATLRVA
jgi:hypothetical protein